MAVARAHHPRLSSPFSRGFFRAVAPLRKPSAANRGRAKSTETTVIGGATASWRRPSRNLAPGKTELAFVPSLFLDFPASLKRASRSRFLSLYTANTASTTPSSSPSSSSARSRPAPPRTALFLSRFYLGFPSPTRRRDVVVVAAVERASSSSFSTFTLPSLLFCSPPAAFLPLLRCRFRRSPRRVPIIPVCASSETISSSPLLYPGASVLPLATLTACVTRRCIRRPGRNPPRPGKGRGVAEEEEEEERNGSFLPPPPHLNTTGRCFLRY